MGQPKPSSEAHKEVKESGRRRRAREHFKDLLFRVWHNNFLLCLFALPFRCLQ